MAEKPAADASTNWLSILRDVFPRWRDRLGSVKDAGQHLVNLLCHPETRSKIYRVNASGEKYPIFDGDAEWWSGRLKRVPDDDGGDDHLIVDYGDERLDFHDPGGHWEFDVRRRDVERWERLYPKLAAPSKEPTSPSEKLSNNQRQKPGPKPDFKWEEIEAKCYELMDENGDFMPEDSDWDCQARLETALMNFCQDTWAREPGDSTLREKLPGWLSIWHKRKTGAA